MENSLAFPSFFTRLSRRTFFIKLKMGLLRGFGVYLALYGVYGGSEAICVVSRGIKASWVCLLLRSHVREGVEDFD